MTSINAAGKRMDKGVSLPNVRKDPESERTHGPSFWRRIGQWLVLGSAPPPPPPVPRSDIHHRTGKSPKPSN